MKYLIVIEQTGTGYSAYSPDIAGCVATGRTREEAEREMKSALTDRKSTRLNSSHIQKSRMPSSA